MNRILSLDTIDAVVREADSAHTKHVAHGGSLVDPGMPTIQKLAALVEECGEVARALTYDGDEGPAHLMEELVQVASVALTWRESILRHGAKYQLRLIAGGNETSK